MRVMIAGGGTGGHVIPALAVAGEVRRRSPENQVLMVGTERGLEARLAPRHGVPLRTLEVGALNRVGAVRAAGTLLRLPLGLLQARQALTEFSPHVVYGVGGYASGPVLIMAAMSGLPIVVHEPNAMPGLTNRLIAPYVARALVAFPEAARYFPSTRVEAAGVPVRAEFFRLPPKEHRAPPPPTTILVSGGSLGAHRLNQAVTESLALFGPDPPFFIHQTGANDLESVRAAYARAGLEGRSEVLPFIDDMPSAFARADLLVCRSGAATLAEITAAGKAALLVPFSFAADDHQLRNARSLQRAGAARVLTDADLSGRSLFEAIQSMLPELGGLERNSRALGRPGAVEKIVDTLERCSGFEL